MIAAQLPSKVDAAVWTGVAVEATACWLGRLFQGERQALGIVLCPSTKAALRLLGELEFFLQANGPGRPVVYLPEVADFEHDDPRAFENHCDRLAALTALQHTAPPPPLLVTTLTALLQEAPAPADLQAQQVTVRVGQEQPFAEFIKALGEQLHYHHETLCETPGQFAIRGGLVDVYPLNHDCPVRIDFFGDEVESLRPFDPTTQRTEGTLERLVITSAKASSGHANATPWGGPKASNALNYLPGAVHWCWLEPAAQAEALPEVFTYPENIAAPALNLKHLLEARGLLGKVSTHDTWLALTALDDAGDLFAHARRETLISESLEPYRPFADADALGLARTQSEEAARLAFAKQLLRWHKKGHTLTFTAPTEAEVERLRESLREDAQTAPLAKAEFVASPLADGFRIELPEPDGPQPMVWVSAAEWFGRKKLRLARKRRRLPERRAVEDALDFAELVEGDYLVHLSHGICRFRGLQSLELDGRSQEVISLEFADEVTLHLKLPDSHLLSRYVGLTKAAPKLARLGSATWGKARAAAERATLDLAADLLRIQAERDSRPGLQCGPDQPMLTAFERAFPHNETPDQLRAIAETKADLEKPHPMDRLLCGDVGFGKTEVALRACLKVALEGRQAAVLVPTTVLCQQHFNTFKERFADTPVVVEMLSRFRTPKQRKEILQQLQAGQIDVLVGTHSLIAPSVKFRELGLLVIDEEHRFGVRQKEKIKRLRSQVDVLAMSATPIPRSLYAALTGVRDLSVIETPPRDRRPIETIVKSYEPELIKKAISYELERGGQVFYLHNRVQTIEATAARLQEMLPEARLAVGHGQMEEKDLERVMTDFVAGRYDVLVCTTIIETGLDIPNCNTLIIEGADRFGLSQLYQLRGRVGRFNRQAYAYLLLHRHAQLLDIARERLGAIRQYNQLGAGFRIAMRDLELRGAGNLLGPQQSGHIAGVGFELYCQLLQQSISRLKGDPEAALIRATVRLDFLFEGEDEEEAPAATPKAHFNERFAALADDGSTAPPTQTILAALPPDYLGEPRLRIDLYRRLARANREAEVEQMAQELADRFGPLPEAAQALLMLHRIRVAAEQAGLVLVETQGQRLKCQRAEGRKTSWVQVGKRFPRLHRREPLPKLQEILGFVHRQT